MILKNHNFGLGLVGAAVLALTACGGGGGSDATPAPTPVTSTATTSVPVTVIDDAIGNAMVCLDKNSNGACDADEPSGKTDAAGKVTLQVAPADVGKFPILALIGADAVDAKYGPVTQAFTMTAPADQSAVVSPLTTLVQSMIANTGVSTAEAAASVQSQTGISVSLFQDFTKNITPAGDTAALIARMIVIVTQQQAAILKSTVGSTAIDGAVVTPANLDQIIQNKVLENLPRLVVVASTPAVQTATTPAAITAALTAPAVAIVTSPATGLTAASVPLLVAINNQNANPVAATPTGVAAATLTTLSFTDLNTWFVRGLTRSALQNTPDANNNIRFVDRRASSTPFAGGGAVASWNSGGTPSRQSDLHFTGTAWAACGLNAENVASVRDAAGNATYDYCNKLETGKTNRAVIDVPGKSMASVITDARAAGYTNISIGNNSAAALTTELGTTTFPAGSSIFYQASTSLTNAPAYYPGIGNFVQQSAANVAAGRTDPNVAAPCSATVIATPPDATSLEALAAVNTGTPCINNAGNATVTTSFSPLTTAVVSSGARNDAWGSTSLSLGVVGTAPAGGIQTTYYTTNTPIRVAFGAANSARYFACQQRSTDGAARNCNLVGTGTYSIATLGDARVMSFAGLPLEAAALTFNRVFVERGGKVYFGYQNKSGVFNSARLNLAGGNALLTQLGIGSVDPEVPLALSAYSYQGTWDITRNASLTDVTRVSVSPLGIAFSSIVTGGGAPAGIVSTYAMANKDTGQFTLTVPDGSIAGNLNFFTGAVTGTFTPTVGVVVAISGARR